MNRIALCDVPKSSNSPKKTELTFFNGARNCASDHSLFVPLHYEPKYSYPVVIWLHGPADDEGQLKKIMPHVSMRNYFGISPSGTELIADDRGEDGYLGFTWKQDEAGIADAYNDVQACLEIVSERFSVNRAKVFLAGYDAGGTMALRLGLLHPHLFAGVVSLGGRMPTTLTPMCHINQVRELPLLLAHGRDSQDYSTDELCKNLRLLHASGISVTIRQYPCEQEVTSTMLGDMNRWMMQIVTGTAESEIAEESGYPTDSCN